MVNLPHDPLRPLQPRSGNHRLCSRAALRIEEIIGSL
jgi:hypothetical protein